jgi:adenylate cyclase
MQRRLAAILAADVVGYSRLMGMDEQGTLATLKSHRRELVDNKIVEHQGRIVKLTGDGMLVEFPSVINAVACATEIQITMRERNADIPEDRCIRFRIGINIGDIIFEDDDIYGDGVNVAARIESVAQPGGVALSGSARDHVGRNLGLEFADRGEQELKNIDRPVRIYDVLLPDSADGWELRAAAGSEKRAKGRPSIAVLPFNNMSGDPEQEYFADGITEDIITDLSRISGLSVIARNSVFTFKGKSVDIQEISKRFNVSNVLEGSVRKSGQRVRITAQLIQGKDGMHLWADRYDRELTDIFDIQDEITKTIVEQLRVKLLPEEKKAISVNPTASVEAYTSYLRGRDFLHRHTKSHYALARRMFAKAVEIDPLFARAYAGIADCDSFLALNYNADVTLESIMATAARALELEDGLAEAHASRGLALSLGQRYPEAEVEFLKAIACDPNLFEAPYFYGRACFAQGKIEQAVTQFERAVELKPDDYQTWIYLQQSYRTFGRKADSIGAALKTIDAAQRELNKHPENSRPAYMGAIALAAVGETDRAREWASRALSIEPDDTLAQYNVACLYSLLGEPGPAFELLERALIAANHETKAWVRNDSDFAPLHSDPRWKRIIELTA